MTTGKNKRISFAIVGMVMLALVPVIASNFSANSVGIRLNYTNNTKMEKDILGKIPIGSKPQFAKQAMATSGSKLSKQTPSILSFEHEDTTFFGEFGTSWWVEIALTNGITSGAKVWIEPAD